MEVRDTVMDAQNIDLDEDSLDAAACQLQLFPFASPANVLREMRRVIRPKVS